MNHEIQDEFTDLPLSRQRKYQMRRLRDGLCTKCGQPADGLSRCLKHTIAGREHSRKMKHARRRYYGSPSYVLAAKLKGVRK